METPLRIVNPLNLNRQISTTFFTKPYSLTLETHYRHHRSNPLNLSPPLLIHSRSLFANAINDSFFRSPQFPNSSRLGFLLSFPNPNSSPQIHRFENLYHFKFEANDGGFFHWNRASSPVTGAGVSGCGKREVAAVLLGWLGARTKHLKRYTELYTSRGIDAITFVVPVRDVLWFDLGRKVENRIRELANELVSWLSEDGGNRRLIFHTFSNTGWLVYGAILGHLQERPDLIERIKGCIVDSGGDPELNPKVWAAGFTTALLRKRNAVIYSSAESLESTNHKNRSKFQDEEPHVIEAALLVALEKIFAFLLKLPDVNQRLSKVITLLSENPPRCSQLYLYSTADKVIPYQSVESFIEHQKTKGRKVLSFNFGYSPHVDHYRTFPDVYSSQVYSFLNEILVTEKQM